MSTNVVMPQLGESVVEGTVGKWFKKPGDKIEQYEPIMEVVTDKVTTEIPAPASGTVLQIIIPEGSTVKAGTVLAIIGAQGESAAVPAPSAPMHVTPTSMSAPPPPIPPTPIGRGDSGARKLTPVVARMIAENNIADAEMKMIRGTGEGGRVSKKDIENFLQARGAPAIALPAWEQPGTGELFRPTEEVFGKPAAPTSSPTPLPSLSSGQALRGEGRKPGAREEIVAVSPMRKAIAEHMVRSKTIAPHVTSVHEADMSRVLAHQKANEADFAKQGARLTFTAYFVQAVVAGLKDWPIVNASYTDQGVMMHRDLNVGIAVAIDDGLIVPVIKNADDKSLLGVARAVNDLATRAREKKLSPDDVQGGTFTITNYGVFGSLFGTPVINQPQSAIMGVGAIQKRAVVINDAIAIRPMIYLSITIDHRLLDGAIGDQFMQRVKKFLEEYPEK
ncbi:MAG: 2-oxo acid dehydrogenase subunit E2 [Chloroflexi bacterium]|nr:2-oxo acid dehydrogenase subunit E2 [Chloroflexota bacterium]